MVSPFSRVTDARLLQAVNTQVDNYAKSLDFKLKTDKIDALIPVRFGLERELCLGLLTAAVIVAEAGDFEPFSGIRQLTFFAARLFYGRIRQRRGHAMPCSAKRPG
jgi:hypothetical protein